MLAWLNVLLTAANTSLCNFIEKVISFIEWYTHSTEIKFYKNNEDYGIKDVLFFNDDEEEALEDYDLHFNEYDWETERRDNSGRDVTIAASAVKIRYYKA